MSFNRGTGLLSVAVACVAFFGGPAAAGAATFRPDVTTDDFGDDMSHCSLREAVQAANTTGNFGGCIAADAGPDTILLDAGLTYSLTIAGSEDANAAGDLDIRDEDLAIASGGSALATIDANGDGTGDPVPATGDRAIETSPNGVLTAVTLTKLGITDGSGVNGGGVRVGAFTGGPAITGSSIYANRASSLSGGLQLEGVNATLVESTVAGNTAPTAGGIYNGSGVTITRSTVSGNTATAGDGGGVFLANNVTRTFTNTTLSGNSATGSGGGIATSNAPLNLVNSTIAGNTADSDTGGGGDGGGLSKSGGGAISPTNTIITDNFDLSGGAGDCAGALTDGGYNLVEDVSGCTGLGPTNITGASALLGPLAANGGSTETRTLLVGSPAWNAGGNPTCDLVDQRSQPRPMLPTRCDIGAVELQPVSLDPVGHKNAVVGQPLSFTLSATDPDLLETRTFGVSNLPPGATFDPGTRTFSWTPTAAQVGPFALVQLSVADGFYADFEDITITVAPAPATPASTSSTTQTPIAGASGTKAAALKKCKKKKGAARKKCRKKAAKLPS